MRGFRGHLAVYGLMLAVPVGRFMQTKTEQLIFKVTQTEDDLEFKVTQEDELEFEVTNEL